MVKIRILRQKVYLWVMKTEKHPFQPFLPDGARILFLGSFPPQPPLLIPNLISKNKTEDTGEEDADGGLNEVEHVNQGRDVLQNI